MKVLVDDFRDNIWGCDIVYRFYKDAYWGLRNNDCDHLYLDHDLGMDGSGYDLLCMLESIDKIPYIVTPVSDNPVGRRKIEACLNHNGYVNKRGNRHVNRYSYSLNLSMQP